MPWLPWSAQPNSPQPRPSSPGCFHPCCRGLGSSSRARLAAHQPSFLPTTFQHEVYSRLLWITRFSSFPTSLGQQGWRISPYHSSRSVYKTYAHECGCILQLWMQRPNSLPRDCLSWLLSYPCLAYLFQILDVKQKTDLFFFPTWTNFDISLKCVFFCKIK